MNFTSHSLHSPFDQHLASIFHFADFQPDHAVERIIPTGNLCIVFELDNIPRQVLDNTTLRPTGTYTRVWLGGLHRHFVSISTHQHSEMLAVEFKRGGAFPFLHFPVQRVNEKILPVEDVLGPELLQVRDSIVQASQTEDKFAIIDEWLSKRFNPSKTMPDSIRKVLDRMETDSTCAYRNIVADYPNSPKHLIAQFRKYVGPTPKFVHRMLRFNETLQALRNNERICWADLAVCCGYADQAHFVREFQLFSGYRPGDFVRQEHHIGTPNFPRFETNFFTVQTPAG